MQTCAEEVENAEYVAPLKPLLSMRLEDPVDEEMDPRSRLREYVDSKKRLVAKKLCYAKPTRRSWPLRQIRMGDLSQLKEDDLSEECVCEPPGACLCCNSPPEMVE